MTPGRAIIFGASGGLGGALAAQLASQGWSVDKVNRADCDLADPASVANWLAVATLDQQPIDLCVFAAGASEAGRLDDLPANAFRRCMEINFHSVVMILLGLSRRAHLPCRQFICVLSGTADLLLAGLGPYSLAKRSLRDWLYFRRLEGSLPDVYILEVWPGPMQTRFNQATRKYGTITLAAPLRARSPQEVASRVLSAFDRRTNRLVLSSLPQIAGAVQSLCPGIWLRLARLAQKISGRSTPTPKSPDRR
jgi:short-subunit dehydrogenase